jgi:hypothetical protein
MFNYAEYDLMVERYEERLRRAAQEHDAVSIRASSGRTFSLSQGVARILRALRFVPAARQPRQAWLGEKPARAA